MKEALLRTLGTRRTFQVLLVVNALVTLGVCYAFRGQLGGDRATYLTLAQGVLHGDYSIWWHLGPGFPDTFRSPGYPLFLASLLGLGGSIALIQFVQCLMYVAAILCLLRTIGNFGGGWTAKNLFLIMLLPSIQVVYYVPNIFPEIPMVLLMSAIVCVGTDPRPHKIWRSVVLGLLFGIAFSIRPVVLFLPFIWAIMLLWRRRAQALKHALVLAGTFLLATLPYGMWNLRHHGMFSINPIEGGGGVLHIGWWSGRLPGYCEHRYWGNCCAEEPLRFVSTDQVPEEIAAYEHEWDRIDSTLEPMITARDRVMLQAWGEQDTLFRTFSAPYTAARERLLKEAIVHDALARPGYSIAFKAYSAPRLWFTGLQVDQWRGASTTERIKALYPFLTTFITFILAVAASLRIWRRRPELRRRLWPVGIALVYFGLIHVPFVIQARYTIPVRLLLLVLITLAFAPREKQELRET